MTELTQPCVNCGIQIPFNAKQHYCSKSCGRQYRYRHTHRFHIQTPHTIPHKKRRVAQVVLGIEIPQLAWDRFLWLRCLIQEIDKLRCRETEVARHD